MSQFVNFRFKENFFFILFITSFIFSIFNSFYQINKFDNYKDTKLVTPYHSMITGDIHDFYNEGHTIANDIRDGKNFFETGGEYRRPYLPSRILALYSLVFNESFYDQDGKVNINNKRLFKYS